MLTQDDLRQIGSLVENIVDKKLQSFEIRFEKKLDAKLEEKLEMKFEEKLKPIKKQLRAIKKDQKIMFNLLDREQMKQRKRIERLEEYVGLA